MASFKRIFETQFARALCARELKEQVTPIADRKYYLRDLYNLAKIHHCDL